MQLRYRYRPYPDAAQRQALARAFGCARVVFNDGLRARQDAREAGLPYVSDGEPSKRIITEAKQTSERSWLGEVSAVVLQQALADLNTAYRNFFASVSGKRKGPKVAPPRFRSKKDNRQTIRFTKNARFSITAGGRLRLPKIGDVPVRWSRDLPSEPSGVTVIKDATGRYFAKIDRWFPSSKLCSACGTVRDEMPLNVRSWICPCGAAHDRDVNAAISILAAGRADRRNACGDPVRPPLEVAQVGEAGSLRGAARCGTG